MSDNFVQDKVVIVTGAGSGFGRLTSRKLAALGARVVAADIDENSLEETVKSIEADGGVALGSVTDVGSTEQMRALANRAMESFAAIDVLINNAGVMPLAFHRDHEAAADAWDRCIDINFKGVLHGIMAVHDQMIQQGRGHVVNISSIYGNFPVIGAGVYGATKAAVNFLSESLRFESQGKIKVTVIKPTGVPATNLGSGVINREAVVGILGVNAERYGQEMEAWVAGQLPAGKLDVNNIEYFSLDPELLADNIVYAINQPWGVSIAEVTVRASGDAYIL